MAASGKLPLVAVGGVVVAIAAATWFIRARDDAPAPPVEAPAAADAGAAAPSARGPDRPSAPGGPRSDPGERVAAVIGRREEQRATHARKSEELRKSAERSFDAEQVDARWAGTKETELGAVMKQEAFEVAGATPKKMSVECRSSMCRLDGDFTSNGQAEDWVMLYMASVGSAMPNSVVTRTANPDGSTSVRIYGHAR